MAHWPYTDEQLRTMYRGGHGNATARRFARFWAAALGTGLFPRRWVTLEVPGRRTGRITRYPLGMADWHGHWYLVSMLGNDCNWVRNARAAGGIVTLRHGRARACRLVEVPVGQRAPILKRYLGKVPGARPHIPVDRTAPLAEFETIAARYPAFRVEPAGPSAGTPEQTSRKRHWLRWTLIGLAALVVLILAVTALAVKLTPVPAPLGLPATAAAPAGSVDGTYQVASGSVAGFRIQQTVLGLTSDVVGRTTDVTGTVTVTGGQVTVATVRVNLLALTSGGGKPAPQFAISLDTQRYPNATIDLAQPVPLGDPVNATTIPASARLNLHGVTRTVTVPLTVRRDGANLDAAGSVPVAFADWNLARPKGYGSLGSLADHGVAEFLLILHRS